MKTILAFLPLVFYLFHSVDAGKEKNYCNVCRAVVEEANWKISQSDQKKTIQVGSFRVDPHGNQNVKEKMYARSESHVEEIFESICNEMRNYAELKQEDGYTTIVRTKGRFGTRLETKDYNLDMMAGEKLLYKCHDFLENHEEDVMGLLQREDIENYENVICGEQTSVCTGKELSSPLIELPEAEAEPVEIPDESEEELNSDDATKDEDADTDASEDENTTEEEKDEL